MAEILCQHGNTRKDCQVCQKLISWMGSALGKFRPWVTPDGRSPQREYIQAAGTHRIRIFRAGNRCGKSEVNAWDHASIACEMHPYYRRKGPTRGWIVSLDWNQGVGAIIWPKLKRYIPPSMIRSITYIRKAAPEIPASIILKNGSEIHFRSAESGRSKFQGTDLDWAWIDEEIEAGIVEEVQARLLDRGGMLSVSLTPVSRMAWVADLESKKDGEGNIMCKVVRASMRDAMEAGILDRTAVESFLANLPDRQRRVRELGDYASLEGMVYPEFNRTTHCLKIANGGLYNGEGKWMYPWPLPKSWQRYASMDFGYTVPSAVVIAAIDPYTSRIIIEKCLYSTGIRMSKWGEELKKGLLPNLEVPLIVDHDAMERAELAACGITTAKAHKFNNKTPGLEAVQRALMLLDEHPKLMFVMAPDAYAPRNELTGREDCHWLLWELERYRYKEKKDKDLLDVKDEPIKKDDHAMDALRYLIFYLEKRGMSQNTFIPPVEKPANPFDGMVPPSPWQ